MTSSQAGDWWIREQTEVFSGMLSLAPTLSDDEQAALEHSAEVLRRAFSDAHR